MLGDNHLVAEGDQWGRGYRARWSLETTSGWVTRRLVVDVTGDGWTRHLELIRDDLGAWQSRTATTGSQPEAFAAPGLAKPEDLREALDCDLGLCPLTNTMPIRRLGLLEGTVPLTPLMMAWVEMPSLAVIASDQYYASHSRKQVRYVSGTREVDVLLSVDDHGVVTHYPGLASSGASEQSAGP